MSTLFVARVLRTFDSREPLLLALVGRRLHKNLDRGRPGTHVEVERLLEILTCGRFW